MLIYNYDSLLRHAHLKEEELNHFAKYTNLFTQQIPNYLTYLHDWLIQQPSAHIVFQDEKVFDYVKQSQREYWTDFFHGELNEYYFNTRKNIGIKHAKILQPISEYCSSISFSQEWWCKFIVDVKEIQDTEKFKLIRIFNKLVLLDLFIVTSAYYKIEQTTIEKTYELNQSIIIDNVTKLYNRDGLLQMLQRQINIAKFTKAQLGVLYIDIDNFKTINDTYGHLVGDKLLIELSYQFRKIIQAPNIIARLDGDEFVITISSSSTRTEYENILRNLENCVAESFIINNQSIPIVLSIGLSIYPIDGKDGNTLINKADAKMYEVKTSHKLQASNTITH